jgi:hypothetical protein
MKTVLKKLWESRPHFLKPLTLGEREDQERRRAWIDRLILRTKGFDASDFFILFRPDAHEVQCRRATRSDYLDIPEEVFGQPFAEENWDAFWPLFVERLEEHSDEIYTFWIYSKPDYTEVELDENDAKYLIIFCVTRDRDAESNRRTSGLRPRFT